MLQSPVMRGILGWLLAAIMLSAPLVLRADNVESAIMPGKVIEGHAKLESDCKNCHVRFNRNAQSGLCLDCHKDVARDVQQKQGYHGRIPQQECRACHTDHKGREMNIAPVNPKAFDHHLTNFVLKGAHTDPKVQCRDCHVRGKKYREAPMDCVACHRKDDKHKGTLGNRCADCHNETKWKDTRFDHSKTHFPLTGKHIEVACRECHVDPSFKGTPTQCVACHRKDDERKGHHGKFGTKCETCHTDREWKAVRFDHNRDTKFMLRGKHQIAKCTSCHTGSLHQEKLATQCVACHRKDDESKGHHGRFGTKCETCHTEKDWRATVFDHNKQTKYPLIGKHAEAKCAACHTGFLYKDKLKTECISCHLKDDKHRGQEGRDCQRCHTERSWKTATFDHGLAQFPLLGKHAKVACEKCHTTSAFRDAKTECVACHRKDDKHKMRLGTDCGQCHNARDWRAWNFDHNRRTHFVLDGAHKGIDCLACHRRPMERKVSLSGTCDSCHDDEDVHNGGFGRECGRCHTTSSFKELQPGISRMMR